MLRLLRACLKTAWCVRSRPSTGSERTVFGWAIGAGGSFCLVLAAACGPSEAQGPGASSPMPGAIVTPAAGQPVVTPRIDDVAPEEVESLLSGDVLDRFRELPTDYQEALAAYLAFGLSPDLMPVVAEQKMAQWPEDPAPLRDLLGPDRYVSFEKLYGPNPRAPYYAYFLLTYYVYVLNTEDSPDGQRQAVRGLVDAFGDAPSESVPATVAAEPSDGETDVYDVMDEETAQLFEELSSGGQDLMMQIWERMMTEGAPRHAWEGEVANHVRAIHEAEYGENGEGQARKVRVPRPPLESVLTPAALARLDQLGPSFQQAIRAPFVGASDIDIKTLAIMFTQFEIFLLKTPPGLELPAIEAHLSEQELADLKALPEDIRNTVEPIYHDGLVQWFAGLAIYPSLPTMIMPDEEVLSTQAKRALSFGKIRDQAGRRNSGGLSPASERRQIEEHSIPLPPAVQMLSPEYQEAYRLLPQGPWASKYFAQTFADFDEEQWANMGVRLIDRWAS